MLAYIKGVLVARSAGSVIVETQGLALRLQVATSLSARLPPLGEQVKLYTHLQWREDGPQLYGFFDAAEAELFLRLISVSGIGPKVALAVLGFAPPAKILVWLMNEDFAQLRKVPGVGLKTAQRMVLELKEKATALAESVDLNGIRMADGFDGAKDSPTMQALEALMSLGYDSGVAAKVLAEVQLAQPEVNLEALIFEGLKRLAR